MLLTIGHADHRLWLQAGALFLLGLCAASQSSAASITTEINPSWTRPTAPANAASTLTTYAEWDGFAVAAATNQPTGNSVFGSSLFVPTAGDSSSSASGSDFVITNGTANNSYYSNAPVGDIYSPFVVITPQIIVPGYNVAGNQLNFLVQAEADGQQIDASLLNVNGVPASSLSNYSVTQTYTDGGTTVMGGSSFRNDYAWTFTLPSDTASVQLDFGWGVTSAAFVSAVVDTQSVPVPEPSTLLLGSLAGALLWKVKRKAGLNSQMNVD